ncbi:Uncharacterized protein Nst1_168 [Candidatus Nanobsidianus stetteri]|jgi:hypothetical protein|uniref:Uncharacterized protein n=1 Tax=Nanobsidianus stetteri TaxID=1294122 RepID=R1E555_NANST|nr:Uncharacterized protein Nst1_168 [Candidatus Nanobsidianus stetteri]
MDEDIKEAAKDLIILIISIGLVIFAYWLSLL